MIQCRQQLTPGRIRRLWLMAGYTLVAVIVVMSLIPAPPVDMGSGRDKIYHALAYGTLMLWFVQAYARSRWLAVGLLCCALGVSLEYAQRLTGYREFGYEDMLANTAGIAIGWLLAAGGIRDGVASLGQWMRRAEANEYQ